jgi:hypothetical protein
MRGWLRLAVDGTRTKAVNNKDRKFTRASLSEFIKLADAILSDVEVVGGTSAIPSFPS